MTLNHPDIGKLEIDVQLWSGFWNVSDCKDHREMIFVFGDNIMRHGKGGQAVIRDEPNAMGVTTTLAPSSADWAFLSDAYLEANRNLIRQDILNVLLVAHLRGKGLYIPEGGFGTGLGKLPERAPKTFAALNELLREFFGFDNEEGKLVRD